MKHGKTKAIAIDPEDNTVTTGWNSSRTRGTSTNDQGPAPGQGRSSVLGMDTPLYPFTKSSGEYYTSNDCVDIEKVIEIL